MTQSETLALIMLVVRFETGRDSMSPKQILALHALLTKAGEADGAKVVEEYFNDKVERSRVEAAKIAMQN